MRVKDVSGKWNGRVTVGLFIIYQNDLLLFTRYEYLKCLFSC